MDAPSATAARSLALGGILLVLAGCAAPANQPAPLPPVSELPEKPPEARQTGEDPVAAAPRPSTVVVVDPGVPDDEAQPKSLAEAAAAEKERRARAGKPVVELDDTNIAQYGKNQQLTVASPGSAATANPQGSIDDSAEARRTEAYWRERGLEIRRRWREAVERVDELQGRSEQLRQRFYATDDPYVRDNQIKPEWDRVLDELDEARRTAERAPDDLERFLDEGRRAGALPGWLREGIELEPNLEPRQEPGAEPTEPVVAPEPSARNP